MASQTQAPLTILASSIFFGAAGFWLMPENLKGATVGAVAGGTAAAAHVQQTRRIRKLAIAQQSDANRLKEQVLQTARTIESLGLRVEEQKANDPKPAQKVIHPPQPTVSLPSVPVPTTSNRRSPATEVSKVSTGIAADTAVRTIVDWFENRDIEVRDYYEPDPLVDKLLNGLSLYLGDNYTTLKSLHWRLRNNVGKKRRFDLTKASKRVVNIHNRYIKKLKSSDYLDTGRIIYKDGETFVIAKPHDRSDVQGFLDGEWFERYIYEKVVELLDSEGVDYQCLRQTRITYGKIATELDLFLLVNGQPLLIECKTGQSHTQGLKKFNKHQEKLNLDASSAVFVVLDIDEAEAHLRTTHWGFTVADQNDFLTRIQETVRLLSPSPDEEDDEEATETASSSDTNSETNHDSSEDQSLEQFFKERGINLTPQHRPRVFRELLLLMERQVKPASFYDISKALRDLLKKELSLSRDKVAEILDGLRAADLFLDEEQKPVRNRRKPIYSIASSDLDLFERKCIEHYTEKILNLYDPDFFEDEENIALFAALTYSQAPSAEAIEQIRKRTDD